MEIYKERGSRRLQLRRVEIIHTKEVGYFHEFFQCSGNSFALIENEKGEVGEFLVEEFIFID